ncbi:hypothetical protein [Arenibacter echinorum]|uniref:Uncharacterized protein n=1 Tax=Arenibacter echinorum TaxID=440515 RepID=A0A327RAS9_9FLAO|nr:hypothetical protein [Arenibacter echinorum]RAJ12714.1 hypothetical protein LV92_01950 [Arenibacter echinorum]
MNIPQIHTNLIWDLTALFLLLTIGYLTILFFLRKTNTLLKWNNREEKKKHLRGILCELLLYEQGKLKMPERELIDLKVELWKLLRQSSNKRIMSKILMEMNNDLDDGAQHIISRLSKEFGLQINAFENLDIGTNGNNTPQNKAGNVDHLPYTETIMEAPKMNQPSNNNTNKLDTKTDVLMGEELDLSFVPLITNNEDTNSVSSPEVQEVLMISNDLEFLTECLGNESFERNPYEAIFEEIYGENIILSPNKPKGKDFSFLNIDFLPLITEIEEEIQEPITNINELEVEYEVVLDPQFKKQISDILKSHVEEQRRVVAIEEDDNLLDLGEMDLPAAKFYTDWEFKKVKLLHSIEEMGDIREVPLLNEMLDEEENESIGNLIKEIIFRFLSEYPMDIDEEFKDNNLVDFGENYVFNHLFSALDRESQLLLLQEIQQIGDLSDLYFLETLHNHSDKAIREKAKLVSFYMEAKIPDIPTSSIEILSGDSRDLKKQINEPSKLHLDPSITFEVGKSGFISTASSKRETQENDKAASLGHFVAQKDKEEETLGYNDLFNIDFDITTSEHITFYNNSYQKGEESLEELEEIKFLDQLKDLTNKIFKNK